MVQPAETAQRLPLVLIVDDDADFLEEVRFVLLADKVCDVVTLSDSGAVLDELADGRYAVLFMDWIMPGLTGADLLPVVTQRHPTLPVIVMTGVSDVETAVRCMRQGATDFLTKPLDRPRLVSCLANALKLVELSSQNRRLQEYLLGDPLLNPEHFREILTNSEKLTSIFKIVETIAPFGFPVMITGETGVGKELFSRALHAASGLKGEFVPLNVAGLDAHLFEDTLFGHKKGAFTGANEHREGLIARAQGGTLFLDEIGDLTPESQIKLLRLLQEREYYRLGSDLLQKSSARIIVATNRNLELLMAEGKFRADLYHRLRYHRLQIPPLRERSEDILLLVDHAVTMAAESVGKAPPRVATELRILLTHYDYPGNVRELLNMVSSAVVANRSGVLTRKDFPELLLRDQGEIRIAEIRGSGQFSMHMVFPSFPTMAQVENVMLREAFKITGKKQGASADLMGICRQTVKRKLAEMGL